MLESTCETSRERITLGQRQQMIGWLTELLPQQGVSEKDAKRRSWTRTNFDLVIRVLYRKPESSGRAWDLGCYYRYSQLTWPCRPDPTAKAVHSTYYGATREEVTFLIKLCKICHQSKSKGPLKPIVSTAIFQRVQIDLIDMRSTPDVAPSMFQLG